MISSNQVKSHNKHSVIIFDWDDTLCCTSYLSSSNIHYGTKEIPNNIQKELLRLDLKIKEIITYLIKQHSVIKIITNSQIEWFVYSAKYYLPSVYYFYEHKDIDVISARTNFANLYPNEPDKWKKYAFSSMSIGNNNINFISFGDNETERNAAHNLEQIFKDSLVKSIKFIDNPTCEQLYRQLEMIQNNINFIIHHNGNLDLMLTISIMSNPTSKTKQNVETKANTETKNENKTETNTEIKTNAEINNKA